MKLSEVLGEVESILYKGVRRKDFREKEKEKNCANVCVCVCVRVWDESNNGSDKTKHHENAAKCDIQTRIR